MKRTEDTTTAALRQAADFLDHYDLPHAPYVTSKTDGTIELTWYLMLYHNSGRDLAQQKADAAAIVHGIGGTWDKAEVAGDFRFLASRGLLRLNVTVARPAVCERVVTGAQVVTRRVPAQDAVEEHTVTETVEQIEWRCQPLLAKTPAPVAS